MNVEGIGVRRSFTELPKLNLEIPCLVRRGEGGSDRFHSTDSIQFVVFDDLGIHLDSSRSTSGFRPMSAAMVRAAQSKAHQIRGECDPALDVFGARVFAKVIAILATRLPKWNVFTLVKTLDSQCHLHIITKGKDRQTRRQVSNISLVRRATAS
jgi:hypothetical protein